MEEWSVATALVGCIVVVRRQAALFPTNQFRVPSLARKFIPFGSMASMIRESRLSIRKVADVQSVFRILFTIIIFRLLRIWPRLVDRHTESVNVLDGLTIHFRWNRGDIQSLREVIFEECYRLPVDISPRTIVDLGANIGLASLYFHAKYHRSSY